MGLHNWGNFDHEEHDAKMSKHKKVHQIGNPRNAQNKHHAEVNAAEVHKLEQLGQEIEHPGQEIEHPGQEIEHPGQAADPTNENDPILAIAGRELKETSQNVGNAVKREVEQLRPYLDRLAEAGSLFKNARSAREFASVIIDSGEKIGNRIVQFDEKMAEVTHGTPLAPLLRMQAGLRKRIVEGSSWLARSVWRIESAPNDEQA